MMMVIVMMMMMVMMVVVVVMVVMMMVLFYKTMDSIIEILWPIVPRLSTLEPSQIHRIP